MSIFSCLLIALALSISGIHSSGLQSLSFKNLDYNFVFYIFLVLGSTKVLTHTLNRYLLSFSYSSCLINQTPHNKNHSLQIYLECLILYAIFSSASLKSAVLYAKIDTISIGHSIQLITNILIPFSYISLLVVIVSAGINLFNHSPKKLVYREANLLATYLVLLLSICLIIQNYSTLVNS